MSNALIIGAGFGGLALAIRLQAAGISTRILEKRDKPGGRAYVYNDMGFTFDAGPTVITDPSSIEELFNLAGKKMNDYLNLLPVKPLYRLCWESGASFDYDNDMNVLKEQIRAFNQEDVEGYQQFLDYSRMAFNEGYLKLGAMPFIHFRDMIKAVPQLIKLRAWRTVYDQVARYIQDEHLRQVFSFHALLIGGNPFETSSIYTLIHALEREWGVWFPSGGTGALVNALAKLFVDLGGEIELNAEVNHIIKKGNRVTAVELVGGRRVECDALVSNADVVHTYSKLLKSNPKGVAKPHVLERKEMSNSLFVVYFGLSHLHSQLAHHTICFSPNYGDSVYDAFNSSGLPKNLSLYLHSPCITDPSLAPPGYASYYVLAPVPHLGTADLDWDVEGPGFCERIFNYLEKYYMPGLREQLITYRIFTPTNFRDDLNAHLGSAFSLKPLFTQSAWFRPHNKDRKISNLYLVGAGTHPGAGVSGVICSAKATATIMLEEYAL